VQHAAAESDTAGAARKRNRRTKAAAICVPEGLREAAQQSSETGVLRNLDVHLIVCCGGSQQQFGYLQRRKGCRPNVNSSTVYVLQDAAAGTAAGFVQHSVSSFVALAGETAEGWMQKCIVMVEGCSVAKALTNATSG
jgi:hypothetical protein